MNTLPYSSQLKINALARSFDNMSESYKVFWFKGVMDVIKSGKQKATFREIINQMIISAWYMVSEYHLNLGPSDTLEKLVLRAMEISELKSSSRADEIISFIADTSDSEIRRALNVLTLNVPYRLHAPFMPDYRGSAAWKNRADVMSRINGDDSLIYYFGEGSGLDTEVIIRDSWFEYLSINQAIVSAWIEYNMILYLQRRNPNVPGIASKLYPPTERKLTVVGKFWKTVAKFRRIEDIYDVSGSILENDISIDHFVPWSYVAHDEMWNLVPTAKRFNSSKSNLLPDWDIYFPRLCRIEYQSYEAVKSNKEIYRLFEQCKKKNLNSDEVAYKLYRDGLGYGEFSKQLEELILPAYMSAQNMGFGEWKI